MTTPITKQITIEYIDAQTLYSKFDKIEQIVTEAKALNSNYGKDQLLTREETARMLKISLPTLHDWTNRGILQSYRIGNTVRYKDLEVVAALMPIKGLRKRII